MKTEDKKKTEDVIKQKRIPAEHDGDTKLVRGAMLYLASQHEELFGHCCPGKADVQKKSSLSKRSLEQFVKLQEAASNKSAEAASKIAAETKKLVDATSNVIAKTKKTEEATCKAEEAER